MKQILSVISGKQIIFLLATLIVFLLVAQLILSNQLATSSENLSKILSEVERLERENRDLAVQVYQKGSILNLKELAAKTGFTEPVKFFFVRQNFLVAENLR